MVEIGRMHAQVRHGMLGSPEIGIVVKDDVIVWGQIPENESEDQSFVDELIKRAKSEAART